MRVSTAERYLLEVSPTRLRTVSLSQMPYATRHGLLTLLTAAADKLRAYFSAFGPVTDAVVMKDPISRRSRGFGFITYADPSCVERALAQPNHILDNRRVSQEA